METLAGYGLTRDQIAAVIGVSVSLLDHNDETKQAITRGREKAIALAAQTAFTMAVKEKNPQILMFWLKTQARWRERHEFDLNHNMAPIIIQKLNGEEIILTHRERRDGQEEND